LCNFTAEDAIGETENFRNFHLKKVISSRGFLGYPFAWLYKNT